MQHRSSPKAGSEGGEWRRARLSSVLRCLWCALAVVCFVLIAVPCRAEVVRYVDKFGNTHYTSDRDAVPAEYRDQLDKQTPLPPIGKITAPRFEPITPGRSGARGSKQVDIFVTDWCPYCRSLEKFLKSEGIAFRRHDIEKSTAARQRYMELGGSGIPVTTVGSRVIRGFRTEEILEALGR